MRHITLSIVAATAFVGCAIDEDPVADSTPPPADMTDYVPTPMAWVHKSCVIEVEDGATVAEDSITHVDGSVEPMPACAYPAITNTAKLQLEVAGGPPKTNGWIESADWHPTHGIGAMAADFVVPAGPAVNDGQLLYLFPGLERLYSDPKKIMQPVLQWGLSPAGGGAYWAYASWVVYVSGTAVHSSLVATAPGHTIRGVMQGSSCGTDVCSTWDINTYDQTSGTHVSLHHTGKPYMMEWVAGAAFEAYNVASCWDFPLHYVPFTGVHVRNTAGALMTPSWRSNYYIPLSDPLRCSEFIYTNNDVIHLHFLGNS